MEKKLHDVETEPRENNLLEILGKYHLSLTDLQNRGGHSFSTITSVANRGHYPKNEDTRRRMVDALCGLTGEHITQDDVWPPRKEKPAPQVLGAQSIEVRKQQ